MRKGSGRFIILSAGAVRRFTAAHELTLARAGHQGESDSVHLPGRHAQFIAEHIPYPELWMTEGAAYALIHGTITSAGVKKWGFQFITQPAG